MSDVDGHPLWIEPQPVFFPQPPDRAASYTTSILLAEHCRAISPLYYYRQPENGTIAALTAQELWDIIDTSYDFNLTKCTITGDTHLEYFPNPQTTNRVLFTNSNIAECLARMIILKISGILIP